MIDFRRDQLPNHAMDSHQRFLITGGAGYVGSCVAAYLLKAGYEVTVFDKLVYGGEALLPFHRHERLRLARGDVRVGGAVGAALQGVDAVVHFAAVVGEAASAV